MGLARLCGSEIRAISLLVLKRATLDQFDIINSFHKVAYAMVADHGMGKSAPNLSFQEARSQQRRVNLWSNRLQHEMDEEVNSIVQVLIISF